MACSAFASESDLVKTLPERTVDGRFDTRCFSWGKDASRDFCETSFYRLLAAPEKYHGRLIGVIGFLVRVFDRPVLFVNRDSYEAGAEYEGVALVDVEIPGDIKGRLDDGVWPVLVVGEFDAKYTGIQIPRLGALRKIQSVAVMKRLPGSGE